MSTRTISTHKNLKGRKIFRTAFMNSNTLIIELGNETKIVK